MALGLLPSNGEFPPIQDECRQLDLLDVVDPRCLYRAFPVSSSRCFSQKTHPETCTQRALLPRYVLGDDSGRGGVWISVIP